MKVEIEIDPDEIELGDLFREQAAGLRGSLVDLRRMVGTLGYYGQAGAGATMTLEAIRQSLTVIIEAQGDFADGLDEAAAQIDERTERMIAESWQPRPDPLPPVVIVNPQNEPTAAEGLIGLLLCSGWVVAALMGIHDLKQWRASSVVPATTVMESNHGAR
ncbi:hypothetical protein [Sphingomonas corticis]|uniref:Uncharacterized protein n=1 Tax=Sphingomonas corticis TaxID=2722791 RepID=A0ABX1CRE0_9SPHN|nr:hypothetical protein [Sphingomonas corticis]NJR80520.1 hypothetical protein [Sphingomonas corticis]